MGVETASYKHKEIQTYVFNYVLHVSVNKRTKYSSCKDVERGRAAMNNGNILYTYMSVTAISYSTRAHINCKHCRVKTWDQASLSRLSERERERVCVYVCVCVCLCVCVYV